VVLLSLGVIISAAYAIRTVGRLFTGPVRSDMAQIDDLRRSELLAVGILTAGILIFGIYPAPLLELFSASVTHMSESFSGYF
jgi:NADH-quinone oxidoreductase subunit M